VADAPDNQRLFGELRSLLQLAPDEPRWRALCDLLSRWPAHDPLLAEQVLPYALDHLRRWPDALRVAPRAWIDQALLGKPPAPITLATTLDAPYRGLSARDLSTLATCGALDHWRIIRLTHSTLRAEGAWVLASAPCPLHTLDLSYCSLGDAGAAQLARADHWHTLRSLSLVRNDLGPDGLEALILAAFIPDLSALDLSANWLTDPCAEHLATPRLRSLRSLHLASNRLGDRGVRVFMESRWAAPRLRRLDLSANGISPDGAQAIAWRAFASPLESLDLARNMIGARGLHALAESSRLDTLQHLGVASNSLRDDALWAFTDTPHLPHLASLDLADNGITDAGIAALVNSDSLPALHTLDLSRNLIADPQSLQRLLDWPHTTHLTSLSLANNDLPSLAPLRTLRADLPLRSLDLSRLRVNEDDAHALAHALGHMPALQHLAMEDCSLTAPLLQILLHTPHLHRLRSLHIGHNSIGDAGARMLATAPALANLTSLKLDPNGISRDGAQLLITSATLSPTLRAHLQHDAATRQER
jgi:Ran GTPase-activating protein (RanGAP) involved in mRNA processing and transport